MALYQSGDVVLITKGLFKGVKAIVTKDTPMTATYIPIKTITNEREFLCDYSFLMSLENKNIKSDYDTLIDLALDTKDERWFNELIVKKQLWEVIL